MATIENTRALHGVSGVLPLSTSTRNIRPFFRSIFSRRANEAVAYPAWTSVIRENPELTPFRDASVSEPEQHTGHMNGFLASAPQNDAMGPAYPNRRWFAIDPKVSLNDGDIGVIDVVIYQRTEFQRVAEQLYSKAPGRMARYLEWILPDYPVTEFTVLRRWRVDGGTGTVSLETLSADYPPLVQSQNVEFSQRGIALPYVTIFGHPTWILFDNPKWTYFEGPDKIETPATVARNADCEAVQQQSDTVLGYGSRLDVRHCEADILGNDVHLGLARALAEEAEHPEVTVALRVQLKNTNQERDQLSEFRENESSFRDRAPYYPIDRFCARMFRAGQLSRRLAVERSIHAAMTVEVAEHLVNPSLMEVATQRVAVSPLYKKAVKLYRATERDHKLEAAEDFPIVRIAALMLRAGQLVADVERNEAAA